MLATALLLAAAASASEYEVGPGDVLHVQVYDEADLTTDVEVSRECTVTLALVGRVEVCGHTLGDVERTLNALYADGYLKNPTVAVRVAQYHSQRVDVLGEVVQRGPIWLEGPTSLVEVISLAGGTKADNVVDVEVTSADGAVKRYDLRALTERPDAVQVRAGDTVVLAAGEVVYVEGNVKKPGSVTMAEHMTVTQALALAGGPDDFADLRRVLVRHADGSQQRVNIQRVRRGRAEDFQVVPSDHIVVPRSAF
jgi:polysaccharide export outer membrane protein